MALKFSEAKKVYLKRAEQAGEFVEDLADTARQKFVYEAKKETEAQHLVRTSKYIRAWGADVKKDGINTEVHCLNEAEYASHLEYGHRIVIPPNKKTGRPKIDTGRKTKGRFVGKYAFNKTRDMVQATFRKIMEKVIK